LLHVRPILGNKVVRHHQSLIEPFLNPQRSALVAIGFKVPKKLSRLVVISKIVAVTLKRVRMEDLVPDSGFRRSSR